MRNSETTTSQCDENAWVREFEHKQMVREQRKGKHEGWDGRTHELHGEQQRHVDFCGYKLMEQNNEINN